MTGRGTRICISFLPNQNDTRLHTWRFAALWTKTVRNLWLRKQQSLGQALREPVLYLQPTVCIVANSRRTSDCSIAATFRSRLTDAEQEWEKLTNTLSALIGWIEDKSIEVRPYWLSRLQRSFLCRFSSNSKPLQMLAQQPVGGSLSAVMAQGAWMKNTEKEMEQKVLSFSFRFLRVRHENLLDEE